MADKELHVAQMEDLRNNPYRQAVCGTADCLDFLEYPFRGLQISEGTRVFLTERTLPFIYEASDDFHQLHDGLSQVDRDEFLRLLEEARLAPPRVEIPPRSKLINTPLSNPSPGEAFRHAFMIFSLMSNLGVVRDQAATIPPQSPSEFIGRLREMAEVISGIALDMDDPSDERVRSSLVYRRTGAFFKTGRRIPIRFGESPRESRQRESFELNRMFGLTH